MTHRAHSDMDGGPTADEEHATPVVGPGLDRAFHVRQALRLQRLARGHRAVWMFYLEHNLFEEAHKARLVTIEHLRGASDQWRAVLSGNS